VAIRDQCVSDILKPAFVLNTYADRFAECFQFRRFLPHRRHPPFLVHVAAKKRGPLGVTHLQRTPLRTTEVSRGPMGRGDELGGPLCQVAIASAVSNVLQITRATICEPPLRRVWRRKRKAT